MLPGSGIRASYKLVKRLSELQRILHGVFFRIDTDNRLPMRKAFFSIRVDIANLVKNGGSELQ
jgi:hypothetical protein